jgi:glycosyltransferase involved in cell wall biosynthesis
LNHDTYENTDIVIPIFNEEQTIPELLRRLRAACPGARLIFVDNASSDRTRDLLTEGGVTDLVLHETNLGYGRSLLDGMRHGSGEFVIVIDADLEYFPEDIPELIKGLAEEQVVHGSRFLAREGSTAAMHWVRSSGNALVTQLFNLLFRQRLTDLYTGIRGFRRNVLPLDELESPGFEFVLELSARLVHAGLSIAEVPARYSERSTGSSKMRHIPEFLKFGRLLLSLRIGLGASRRASS